MKIQTVIMDFSGIYREESFFEGREYDWRDYTELEGVNCYCTEESEEKIREKIQENSFEGLHFLDSGNYHYASKFWLEKIQEPFALLVLDNHTDMQESAFFGLLSCGSWVREVLHTNPKLQEVCIIGPSEKLFQECEEADRLKVTAIAKEELSYGGKEKLKAFLENSRTLPLYLSIDKDILGSEAARTNWDQGEVEFSELEAWVRMAFGSRKILGADICGENPQDTATPPKRDDLKVNDETNEKLWDLLEQEFGYQEADRRFQESGQEEIRLSIALERYFQIQEEGALRKRYQEYLSLRLRPAVQRLIEQGKNRQFMKLLEENPINAAMLDSFILEAGRCKNREAQILLLGRKKEMEGFSQESWEL